VTCPSCGGAVEEGADLCFGCGEPMGDSPAARVARAEQAPAAAPAPAAARAPAAAPTAAPSTAAAQPAPRARRVDDEPPMRCPGCGVPFRSEQMRCMSCGSRRPSDE
jgi:hypothetical protein